VLYQWATYIKREEVQTCNPSTHEGEAGGWQVQDQPRLDSEFQPELHI
jgi:hypothetical protein